MFARISNSVVALWLFAAHWVLGYTDPRAKLNEIIVGFVVLVTALLSGCVRPFHYLILLAGAWLAFSPLLLGYAGAAPTANSVICGLLLVALSLLPRHWRYETHQHSATPE